MKAVLLLQVQRNANPPSWHGLACEGCEGVFWSFKKCHAATVLCLHLGNFNVRVEKRCSVPSLVFR